MKLSTILYKQHIGRHFRKHWAIQSKREVLKTPALTLLSKKGIPIHDANEISEEKRTFEKVEVIGFKPQPIKFDETHPNWHSRILLTYKDDNVLLEGLKQAQVLTNTVMLKAGLPDDYILNPLPKGFKRQVKDIILNSHIFDAEQQKLEKRKDTERPAWNFPRDYGVTYSRRNKLMTSKLLNLLELNEEYDIVKDRFILSDLYFSFPFEKDNDLIQLQLRGDVLLVSQKPLQSVTSKKTDSAELPDIKPMKSTITLNREQIYEVENIYPIKKSINCSHPHTVFVHFDKTEVKNLFEEAVTQTQIHGRSLLKTFTVAASYARRQFGENIEELPIPVTVQCVQTDGRLFQFGVLQLNTLKFDDSGISNIWYQTESLPLFEICQYETGKPVLKGFNDDVVKHLVSFYSRR